MAIHHTSSGLVRLLRVSANGVDYMIELANVAAIEDSKPVADSTWTDRTVIDIDFHGQLLPAAKLSKRLAPNSGTQFFTGSKRNYIVVVGHGERAWAMVVDKVSAETTVPQTWIKQLPNVCGNPRTTPFKGVLVASSDHEDVKPTERMILVIDPARLHPSVTLFSEPPTAIRTVPLKSKSMPSRPSGRFQMLNFIASGKAAFELDTYIGLSFSQVLEVIDTSPVLETPFAPSFVQGLTLWRDQVTPIIDLAQRLKLPPMNAEKVRWAIARATPHGDPIGFPIRPGVDVLRLPAPHRSSSLAFDSNLILGAFQLDDRTLLVPDLAAASYCR